MADGAAAWQVHERTVRREIYRGNLSAVKVAGVWRIRAVDAARYLDERAALLDYKALAGGA